MLHQILECPGEFKQTELYLQKVKRPLQRDLLVIPSVESAVAKGLKTSLDPNASRGHNSFSNYSQAFLRILRDPQNPLM